MRKDLLKAQKLMLYLLKEGVIFGNYNAMYTDNKKVFDTMANEFQIHDTAISWKKEKDWSLKDVFPERYKRQKEMVDQCFIPCLERTQKIADLASANGEWSMYVAKYVEQVDGYEYSKNMVKTAKKKAKEQKTENVTFYHGDARNVEFRHLYDNFMMLGLLTCICEPADAQQIVSHVAENLIGGGVFADKGYFEYGRQGCPVSF